MTRAEWDAERNRRSEAMHTLRHPLEISMSATDSMFYGDLATATMPPCPVEPLSVACGPWGEWAVTHDGKKFTAQHRNGGSVQKWDAANMAALVACASRDSQDRITERVTLELIALRDGPLAVVTP